MIKYVVNKLLSGLMLLMSKSRCYTQISIVGPKALQCFLIQKIIRVNSHVPWPVHWTSIIKCPHRIHPGTRTPGLSVYCYLDGRNGIIFGDNVWVGPYVKIISMNHNTSNYHEYVEDRPIQIGDNCWIGAGATILSGVHLGEHVVVAADSVVSKSFAENDILIAGVPARIVKKLPSYQKTNSFDHSDKS